MNPLPKELPEVPTGWKRRMDVHLNFGSEGGMATYTLTDANGVKQDAIRYQYDTRKGGMTGFFVTFQDGSQMPEGEGIYRSWGELRAAWPDVIKKAGAA